MLVVNRYTQFMQRGIRQYHDKHTYVSYTHNVPPEVTFSSFLKYNKHGIQILVNAYTMYIFSRILKKYIYMRTK